MNLRQRGCRCQGIAHARLQDIALEGQPLALDRHARDQLIGVFGMCEFHIHARLVDLHIFRDHRQQVFFNAAQEFWGQFQAVMYQHQRQALPRDLAGGRCGRLFAPKELIKQTHTCILQITRIRRVFR
jgi:hypothetical protein